MSRLVIKMVFCSQRYLKEQLPQTEANGHGATGVGEAIFVTHMDVCHLHLQVLDHLGSKLLRKTVLLFSLGLTCHRHHCYYYHHRHKRYHCYHHHRHKRFVVAHLAFLQNCLAFSALANTHTIITMIIIIITMIIIIVIIIITNGLVLDHLVTMLNSGLS